MPRPEHVYRVYPGVAQGIDEWATYIQNRNPKFKTHKTIGVAKSAITGFKGGIMYRMLSHRDHSLTWTAVAVVQPGEHQTHSYRRAKPADLTEPVIIFKIIEEDM